MAHGDRFLGRGMSKQALAADTEESDREYIAQRKMSAGKKHCLTTHGSELTVVIASRRRKAQFTLVCRKEEGEVP